MRAQPCVFVLALVLLMAAGSSIAASSSPTPADSRNPLGLTPTDLGSRQPATSPAEAPAAVSVHAPAATIHELPARLGNRVPATIQGPPAVSKQPVTKKFVPSAKAVRPRVEQGGEDAGSAIAITSIPYADSGYTCGSLDDYEPNCGAGGSPDVVYSYRPVVDGCLELNLCGSNFDTELYVVKDTTGNIVACNDDYCGAASQLTGVSVSAGHTYYIIVDGFGGACGTYFLNVESCPPPPGPVNCPPNAIAEGEPICHDDYVDTFNGGCDSPAQAFSELACGSDSIVICGTYGTYRDSGNATRDTDWYRFTVLNTTSLHFTVTGEFATTAYLLQGSVGCNGPPFLGGTFTNAGETGYINATISAGTYYLFVATSAYGDVPCGSDYYITVKLDSCPAPPEPPGCPAGALAEGEVACYDQYVDTYDGGCATTPPAFFDLPCTPGTTNVCGTYGTYLASGYEYRDTDWYRIVINRTTTVQACVTGQYPTDLYVVNGVGGCVNAYIINAAFGLGGQPACCYTTLAPGTYYLFVATDAYVGVPCGSTYTLSVTRDSCPAPFRLECPATAKPEGEPVCQDGYLDTYDAGCNSSPPSFVQLAGLTGDHDCQAGTVQVCGTYGTYLYQGSEYRDTDWYQMTVTGLTNVRCSVVGEAGTQLLVLNGSGSCTGLYYVCNNSGGAGDTVRCDVTLSAGTYWFIVSPTDYYGVSCGSRYLLSVSRDSCPQPFRLRCPPDARLESEPVCSNIYVDETNGGCNSSPPAFTDVLCSLSAPIRTCGTYGVYQYQGVNYRDTDWYRIRLVKPTHVRYTVVGEAPTTVAILDGRSGCGGTVEASSAGAIGDSILCEADLPPGDHYLFVAPSSFTGVPCGSHYLTSLAELPCDATVAVGGEGAAPAVFAIHAIAPNPSPGGAVIQYELPRAATVRLEVFDIAGHRVRVITAARRAPAGVATTKWDGRNDRGARLAAGAYFVRLAMDDATVTRRLMLIH